jgi:pimeloyl-ACP methyl ester carboxylesterase
VADHVTPRPDPVHWSGEGSGPAVVLLHGLGGDPGFWTAETAALRDGYRASGAGGQAVLASTYAVMNPQARLFLDAVRDVVLPWLFSLGFLADPANAGWLETPPDDGESPAGWLATYQAQRDFDGRAELARIAAPTLVLAGDEDRLVSLADARALADGIPGASLSAFPGSGHLINVELTVRFVAELRAFLEM